MEYENAIEITDIKKSYDGFSLGELSFCVPKGSIVGLVGQNGAGKSTTIKLILNIIKADAGRIQVFGKDSVKDEAYIKNHIAVVFDSMPFHEGLNAMQLNRIFKSIYREWESSVFDSYLERFHLPKKKKIGAFSKGMKMKLQIAAALSHHAELLILDEATAGLDPVVRSEILDVFWEYMKDENHSILMSSHITSDLERIADMVTFMHEGKIILSGYKDELLERHGIIRCEKKMVEEIDVADIVSIKTNAYGASVMISNREVCEKKYSGAVIDTATLDDILLYYVKGKNGREWNE